MGMYDEFELKIPVQCPGCYTGAHYVFQTKDLECVLDRYIQGEPAVAYGYRDLTQDEIDECIRNNAYLQLTGDIFLPIMTRDTSRIVRRLGDGKYPVYDYCDECKDLVYVNAIVKNGIFIGVEPCDKI
jgi:hypothetical protein